MNDPYKVLNISSNASDEEVKRAYKEMSKKYHPDSYVNNPLADLAEDKFKEVQEAYKEIMEMRSNGGYGNSYNNNNSSGSYNAGQNSGSYYNPYGQQANHNQNQYGYYGRSYGRDPFGMRNADPCDLCCKLWCADTMCECVGGDLCTCF